MLCALRKSDDAQVTAWTEPKANAPFICPECKSDVTLRKGTFVVHHFAHKPPVTCSYGVGEKEPHRRCKMEIYEHLSRSPSVTKVGIEQHMGSIRPDIRACINGTYCAIEVQLSTLPLDIILHRTREYEKKRIHVLWLAQWTAALDEERYSPRPWERWVHALYFGRVYYWLHGLTVVPYHFDIATSWVDTKTYFKPGGEEITRGGYDKILRRYKTPIRGKELNLATDFHGTPRDEGRAGRFLIPQSKLFMDQGKKP